MKTEDRRKKREEKQGKERNKPETREKHRHTASKFTTLEKNKTKNKKTSDVYYLFFDVYFYLFYWIIIIILTYTNKDYMNWVKVFNLKGLRLFSFGFILTIIL